MLPRHNYRVKYKGMQSHLHCKLWDREIPFSFSSFSLFCVAPGTRGPWPVITEPECRCAPSVEITAMCKTEEPHRSQRSCFRCNEVQARVRREIKVSLRLQTNSLSLLVPQFHHLWNCGWHTSITLHCVFEIAGLSAKVAVIPRCYGSGKDYHHYFWQAAIIHLCLPDPYGSFTVKWVKVISAWESCELICCGAW